jgi:hypothetical protein
VLFAREPQAAPEQDVPEILQVTPLLAESFVTVVLKLIVWPASIFVCADGEIATEITFLAPPPHPHTNKAIRNMTTTNLFMIGHLARHQ